MYEVKAYHCSYCKRSKLNKSKMKKHESICFFNSDTKSCATCKYDGFDGPYSGCLINHSEKMLTACPKWVDDGQLLNEN